MKTLLLVVFTFSLAYSQYDHRAVHPDLQDAELETAIMRDYKPNFVIDFRDVKDTLYKKVYLHNDSVRCVYTGLSKYLDLDEDPSEFLFQNGGNENINLEHCYPQSKGAKRDEAQADMHHLFPSRVPVNSARGSDPFRDIPDNQTQNWFYKTLTQNNIPSSNKALYSEDSNNAFEPREDFKGNVARAYFYFYTMYRAEADTADPDFFEDQLSTLCDWHSLDPVDSLEWVRTLKIAGYQDNKPNPFVLDCRLARLYCGTISDGCRSVGTEQAASAEIKLINTIADTGDYIRLEGQLAYPKLTVDILSLEGKTVSSTLCPHSGLVPAPSNPGMYLILIRRGQLPLLTSKFVVNCIP